MNKLLLLLYLLTMATQTKDSADEQVSRQEPWHSSNASRWWSNGLGAFSRLWPWSADAKSQNALEHKLLAHGGIYIKKDKSKEDSLLPTGEVDRSSSINLATKAGDVEAEIIDVDIDQHGNYIHTLVIKPEKEQAPSSDDQQQELLTGRRKLVLTHGYFSGVGFYFRNYKEISQQEGWDIYSIDWLGMGRSSRPDYKSSRSVGVQERVAGAEEFFVESLEEWRKRMNIDKMMLCGHSFGGYMSAVYALKYPQHVEKLVLISPIGLPVPPPDLEERLKKGIPSGQAQKINRNNELESEVDKDGEAIAAKPSMQRVALFRLAMSLWDRNYTPQWLIRTAGPFGRRLIDMYVNRFKWLSEEQRRDLAAYTYQISGLPSSSESALGDILRPGAFARHPLMHRLAGITTPTVFMYGQNDWVEHKSGEQVIANWNGKVESKLYQIPDAGHNLHLENPDEFNKAMASEMKKLAVSPDSSIQD